MDNSMDTNMQTKSRHHRRRNNNFTYPDKSSSEPDLTEFNSFSSRWRKGPTEFITVDDLKFYRRRWPPDQLHHTINTAPTSSSFSLYNKSEPYVPFSALKTEYQRQYCGIGSTIPPQATLRRRSTSLKLPARERLAATEAGDIGAADLLDLTMGESEQHAEYHPYTEDEQSQCRRTLAHRPDHQFVDDPNNTIHFDGQLSMQPNGAAATTANIDPIHRPAAGSVTPAEPHGIASKHRTLLGGGQHAAERCHLHLSGELSYAPEYRSQFVGAAPIDKSHSIPQLSNIRFQGKFDGMAEYRDSFREYDRYARCAPIRNPGHLRTAGAGATAAAANASGEYAEKYQAPVAPERTVRAHRQEDQFSLTPVAGDGVGGGTAAIRAAEQAERSTAANIGQDVGDVAKPERGRAKGDFLSLKGSMEYSPDYRCTYVDFPRTRPIINKPPSNIKLGDHSASRLARKSAKSPSRRHQHHHNTTTTTTTIQPMLQPLNVHEHRHLGQPTAAANEPLPFMCPPEVRRARQDLLLKKRLGAKEIISTSQTVEYGSVGNALVADAPAVVPLPPTGGASPRLSAAAAATPTRRDASPVTFRLTVQNVDDPGGGTFKKTTPKFGRRSSVLVKEAHRLRNRSRIVEGNREYAGGGQQHHQQQQQQQQPSHPQSHSRKVSSTSFVVLKEPCKQSRWMKTSWYS